MTHRVNRRPRKFLERLSRTYGLLRSVQCHFLLVGREDAGGAHEEWHVGVRGVGERGGAWATSCCFWQTPPTGASQSGLCPAG